MGLPDVTGSWGFCVGLLKETGIDAGPASGAVLEVGCALGVADIGA